MKRALVLILLAAWFSGCMKPRFPGFSKTDSGLFYQLHILGDEDRAPETGKQVIAWYSIRALNDSTSNRLSWNVDTITVNSNMIDGSIKEAVSMLVEGDSVTLIFNQFETTHQRIHNLSFKDTLLVAELKVLKVTDVGEEQPDVSYSSWKAKELLKEQSAFARYLKQEEIDSSSFLNGIYYLPIKKGKGEKVQSGNTIWIHYKGYFLDGTLFDNTRVMSEPFEFDLGTLDQIIKGMEIGLRQMNKKSKAKFIIPSRLAFGEHGSSTGIVPPFTSVIYEVELLNYQ